MGDDVEWLATDPPMFVAYHGHDGLNPSSDNVLFDRCEPHSIGAIDRGPDDLIAIDGARELRRRGELVGHTSGGQIVVFGPR